MKRLAAITVALALALGAPVAIAKPGSAQVATQVSPSTVEVGQMFHVTLHVQGDDPRVNNPSFAPPAGLDVLGQNLQRRTYTKMDGRRIKTSTAIDVTWQVMAKTVGHYTLPPPTAMVNGKRMSGSVTSIEVVAPNGGAPKGSQSPFPFPQLPGMPKIPGWPFGNDVEPDDDPPAPSRTDLDLAQAPDPLAFVRVVLDKKEAVIGEQVTVSYYLYCRFTCEYREPADPGFPDFKRLPLDKNKATEPSANATVGGQRFATQLLARMAVFPLRTGALPVGAMSVQVTGKRFGQVMDPRVSDTKTVNVTEPPLAGRPPGYAIGDVGQFSITAAVQPRRIDLGGSVAVTLKVAGTGFPPESLRVPMRKGLEWLDPEKKETIDVQGGKVAGTRSFGYVVKIDNSGEMDLGNVELPYWDPVGKKYQVATAALGNITIDGSAPAPDPNAAAPTPNEPLAILPPARKELSPYAYQEASRAFDGKRFWALLAAPPFGFALVTAGAGAARAIRRRRAKGAASPKVAAERALAEAKSALGRNASAEVAQQIERACHKAIEAAFGVKSRGVLLADLREELAAHGASAELAHKASDLLAACDTIRFDPLAESSPKALVAAADELVPKLLRAAKG